MPRPAVTTTLVIAAILELLVINAAIGAFTQEEEVLAEGATATRSTLDYILVTLVGLVTPFVPVLFAARRWVDGFALGSITFAIIIETILVVGWSGSPQHEPAWYFWAATALPAVLIGATYWFYAVQAKT